MRVKFTSRTGRKSPYGHIFHDALLLAVRGPHQHNARFCALDDICGGALGALATDANFGSQPGEIFSHALPSPRLQYVLPFGIGSATEQALEHSLLQALRTAQSLGRQNLLLTGLEWTNCQTHRVGDIIGMSISSLNDGLLPGNKPAKTFEALTVMTSREHVSDLLMGCALALPLASLETNGEVELVIST